MPERHPGSARRQIRRNHPPGICPKPRSSASAPNLSKSTPGEPAAPFVRNHTYTMPHDAPGISSETRKSARPRHGNGALPRPMLRGREGP